MSACKSKQKAVETNSNDMEVNNSGEEFVYVADRFADLQIIRYQIPGWDKLNLEQKKLVYYLSQAGYSGRDIIWDQNYRYNLTIRTALEKIVSEYSGDKKTEEWTQFMTYMKRVWFSNGIHHHYSMDKFMPEFSREYFSGLLKSVNFELDESIQDVMFNSSIDAKKVSLDASKDLLLASASNFYDADISEEEALAFYKSMMQNEN